MSDSEYEGLDTYRKTYHETEVEACVQTESPVNTNPFSEPWEDSDLVLVVASEKFHVHRLVLILNSPVFKAMLKTDFKEAKSQEITLPEKDPHEVLDLLKQVYPQVREEVTMENVEHIMKLADEYQMTSIMDLCASFLMLEEKSASNAMTILLLAQKYKLSSVAEDCHGVLEEMTLQDLEAYEEFEELDGDNMRAILLPRMRRLENSVTELRPQVTGLLACSTWLWSEAKKSMPWCPVHYRNGKSHGNLETRLRKCAACKNVIRYMVSKTNPEIMSRQLGLGRPYTDIESEYLTDNLLPALKELFVLTDGENLEDSE